MGSRKSISQRAKMKEELDKLVASGKIQPRHVEPLVKLVQAGFCHHKSWGFGRITALDGVLGRLNIDFPSKANHSMDLVFSAESLKPIGREHILVRKHLDLDGLKREAALHHLDVVKVVLRSLNGRATVDQIQTLLADVITEDWKKWWETARAEMKRDGHFTVPLKKSEPILYQEQEITLGDRLLAEARAAKGLKARIAVAHEILKSAPDLRDHGIIPEVVNLLAADVQSHAPTMPALAFEGIFMRDDLRQAGGLSSPEGQITCRDILAPISQETPVERLLERLVAFFEELPAAKHRRALETFRDSIPDWGAQVVLILNRVPAKLAGECARILLVEGRGQLLKDTLARLVSQHGASSELLLWLGKERGDHFADILGPEVFRAMITAMERDAFNEKKTARLHDFVLDDQQLLPELIAYADVDVVKDLVRSLQLSPVFDDMDKRSLLGRIVKVYPQIQSMITGDQSKDDKTFVVSWSSLERRKSEYDHLVNKDIPANIKDIAIAKSYGDLRENHEFKAAKEMQKVLHRRKHELELQLARARGTDFANVRTDIVVPGTQVTFTDLDSSKPETVQIFGAWDGDPDRNILSYLTPLAQALMNKAVGTEAEFGAGDNRRRFRIDSITAADAGLVAVPASA
jgi:transcription elongation GreA/GreB family factor